MNENKHGTIAFSFLKLIEEANQEAHILLKLFLTAQILNVEDQVYFYHDYIIYRNKLGADHLEFYQSKDLMKLDQTNEYVLLAASIQKNIERSLMKELKNDFNFLQVIVPNHPNYVIYMKT